MPALSLATKKYFYAKHTSKTNAENYLFVKPYLFTFDLEFLTNDFK